MFVILEKSKVLNNWQFEKVFESIVLIFLGNVIFSKELQPSKVWLSNVDKLLNWIF